MPISVKLTNKDYDKAIGTLKQGGIVAYPTETYYGLAVDPKNEKAIDLLYALKKRAPSKPLSLIVPNIRCLEHLVCYCPKSYKQLMDVFWPGPLTLLFPANEYVSPKLTRGTGRIAVRISSHPIADKLCNYFGSALTSTSANMSNETPLITASDIYNMWGTAIACILDGGPARGGKGSTILECSDRQKQCEIIRDGAISSEDIAHSLPADYTICNTRH